MGNKPKSKKYITPEEIKQLDAQGVDFVGRSDGTAIDTDSHSGVEDRKKIRSRRLGDRPAQK